MLVSSSVEEVCVAEKLVGSLTLVGLQSRFGDESLVIRLVCPQIGTAVLKGIRVQPVPPP